MNGSESTKLLFVVNVDWVFVSHRLPIALVALKKAMRCMWPRS